MDLVSFQQIFMKKVKSPELPAYSAADSQEKDRVQKHHKKGTYYMFRHNARHSKTEVLLPSRFLEGRREASSPPKMAGEERGLLLPSHFRQSSPTKHFTESGFLLVSDPLEDLNFRFYWT